MNLKRITVGLRKKLMKWGNLREPIKARLRHAEALGRNLSLPFRKKFWNRNLSSSPEG